ncbi:hypothetical protein [Nonomuraea guangzhouensis]|uniref:Uncharacterized protein n=1 Tax=Nonomuraea guangzhouensis TaxID=1291555 RepID=A0ABW4GX44_9ACTN|nr:hypothetical protein [Nonomuraea guangzhouensis]
MRQAREAGVQDPARTGFAEHIPRPGPVRPEFTGLVTVVGPPVY